MARSSVASVMGGTPTLSIVPLQAADLAWAATFLGDVLGGRMQARRGELMDTLEGDGLVAMTDERPIGLITWFADGPTRSAEIRALAVADQVRGRGIGRALLGAAADALHRTGVRRAWLVTTNDNLAALALYQKAGWHLAALRAGAIDDLRRSIKPSIPRTGEHGIPIRDEVELVKGL